MEIKFNVLRRLEEFKGVTIYQRNGVFYTRKTNAPDKKRIDNEPNFQKTRENNKEFAGIAKAAQAFRLSFAGISKRMGLKPFSMIVRAFKQINNRGSGERGQRPIQLSQHPQLISRMELNALPFSSICNAEITSSHNAGRNTATVIIPEMDPGQIVKPAQFATHFRPVAALGLVPDFVYNAETGGYEATHPELIGKAVMANSELMDLNAGKISGSTIELALDNAAVPHDVVAVLCLGIEFVDKVGDVEYAVGLSKVMRVLEVF